MDAAHAQETVPDIGVPAYLARKEAAARSIAFHARNTIREKTELIQLGAEFDEAGISNRPALELRKRWAAALEAPTPPLKDVCVLPAVRAHFLARFGAPRNLLILWAQDAVEAVRTGFEGNGDQQELAILKIRLLEAEQHVALSMAEAADANALAVQAVRCPAKQG